MKSPFQSKLEPLALALVFTPEPITTIAGIGLLGYARTRQMRKQRRTSRYHAGNTFGRHYTYRIDMVRGTTITFQTFATRQGQLPLTWPNVTKLYHMPQVKVPYRKAANQGSKINPSHLPGRQREVVLGRPKSSSRTMFPGPRRGCR